MLKRMVELRNGVTIIPELAMKTLTREEMKMIRHFRSPAPVREVSLVNHRKLVKTKILDACSLGGGVYISNDNGRSDLSKIGSTNWNEAKNASSKSR